MTWDPDPEAQLGTNQPHQVADRGGNMQRDTEAGGTEGSKQP